MAKLQLTQPIGAPPEHVFAFFVPQRMPYWYGAEMDSCINAMGVSDFSPGMIVHVSGRLAGRTIAHTAVVTAFEFGRVFEWRFQDEYGVRGRERWEVDHAPKKAGGAVVKFTSEYQIPGRLGRAIDWLLTRHAVARRHRTYLGRLARLAEEGRRA